MIYKNSLVGTNMGNVGNTALISCSLVKLIIEIRLKNHHINKYWLVLQKTFHGRLTEMQWHCSQVTESVRTLSRKIIIIVFLFIYLKTTAYTTYCSYITITWSLTNTYTKPPRVHREGPPSGCICTAIIEIRGPSVGHILDPKIEFNPKFKKKSGLNILRRVIIISMFLLLQYQKNNNRLTCQEWK